MIEMESELIQSLDFNLALPSSLIFLNYINIEIKDEKILKKSEAFVRAGISLSNSLLSIKVGVYFKHEKI